MFIHKDILGVRHVQGKFIRKTLGLCFVESVESLNSKIWHTMIPPDRRGNQCHNTTMLLFVIHNNQRLVSKSFNLSEYYDYEM